VSRIEKVVCTEQPDMVLTIAGDDGHRDHQRLAAAVRAAFTRAARPGASLYEWCLPNELMRRWAAETARLRPDTAHLALALESLGTAAERFTTVIDVGAHVPARRAAIAAHASQVSPYSGLSSELAEAFLRTDHLVRVVPAPAAGELEHELTYQLS
jgi:N-acetyl-1-D-myo-inositol-2-amino-2-deoxy-alpha-D-glucopyranoside deacetylase